MNVFCTIRGRLGLSGNDSLLHENLVRFASKSAHSTVGVDVYVKTSDALQESSDIVFSLYTDRGQGTPLVWLRRALNCLMV